LAIFFVFIICACSTTNSLNSREVLEHKTDNEKYLIQHFKALSADVFSGRKIATQGNIKAQNYIKSTLANAYVRPFNRYYLHPFTKKRVFSSISGTNVIGLVEGTTFKNDYIVLSAHFDHLGTKGSIIYNGADDNASGTAALLAFAKKIQVTPLKHSVILLFTDGEEAGLYGSKAFIEQQKNLLPHIKVNINLDMIAGAKQTNSLHYIEKRLNKILSVTAYNNFKYSTPSTNIKIKRGFKQLGKTNLASGSKINYISASDHGSFNRIKIPFVYYGVGTHINYHTKHDDFTHANLRLYVNAYKFIESKIIFLDQNIF